MYRVEERANELAAEINAIELDVTTNYRLSDAIREGAKYSDKAHGWGDGHGTACALTAAFTAAKARNLLD